MASEELPRDGDLDEVHSRLNQGLKSCRTMISSYRALLEGDLTAAALSEDAGSGARYEEPSNDP